MYRVELTPEAVQDLASLRKFDQVRVVIAMESQLAHEPTVQTRNRKRLRPNQLAEWVLRVDNFRVFYDVLDDSEIVRVIAVGVKIGNDLYVHGQKYEL
jgi:mRNA-degrading endonuclease RelE of RelBE toxin-antitoxin system